ncbi:MAG: hypothetical protein AAGD06_23240 [Acidobacteriota bacterium]
MSPRNPNPPEWLLERIRNLEEGNRDMKKCLSLLKTEIALLKSGGQDRRLLYGALLTMVTSIIVEVVK